MPPILGHGDGLERSGPLPSSLPCPRIAPTPSHHTELNQRASLLHLARHHQSQWLQTGIFLHKAEFQYNRSIQILFQYSGLEKVNMRNVRCHGPLLGNQIKSVFMPLHSPLKAAKGLLRDLYSPFTLMKILKKFCCSQDVKVFLGIYRNPIINQGGL